MPQSPLRAPIIGLLLAGVFLAVAFAEGVAPRNPATVTAGGQPTGDRAFGTTAAVELPGLGSATVGIAGRGTIGTTTSAGEPVQVSVPASSYLAVATDGDRPVGLALQLFTEATGIQAVRIDGRSTARALVGLLPGMLSPDPELTSARLDIAETTIAFLELRDRLDTEPVDLTDLPADLVTLAAAAADEVLLERQELSRRQPDCGDDLQAFAPLMCGGLADDGSALVINGTNAWVALAAKAADRPCALIPPAGLSIDDDGNILELRALEQEATVPIGSCGPSLTVATSGRHTASSALARLVNGLTLLTDHAVPLSGLLGTEVADPRTAFAEAEALLSSVFARGGPLDQLSSDPTAALVADLSVLFQGSAGDSTNDALGRYLRMAAPQMTSVPLVYLPTGLIVQDVNF